MPSLREHAGYEINEVTYMSRAEELSRKADEFLDPLNRMRALSEALSYARLAKTCPYPPPMVR